MSKARFYKNLPDEEKLEKLHGIVADAIRAIEDARELAGMIKTRRGRDSAMAEYDRDLMLARRLAVSSQVRLGTIVPTEGNTF